MRERKKRNEDLGHSSCSLTMRGCWLTKNLLPSLIFVSVLVSSSDKRISKHSRADEIGAFETCIRSFLF